MKEKPSTTPHAHALNRLHLVASLVVVWSCVPANRMSSAATPPSPEPFPALRQVAEELSGVGRAALGGKPASTTRFGALPEPTRCESLEPLAKPKAFGLFLNVHVSYSEKEAPNQPASCGVLFPVLMTDRGIRLLGAVREARGSNNPLGASPPMPTLFANLGGELANLSAQVAADPKGAPWASQEDVSFWPENEKFQRPVPDPSELAEARQCLATVGLPTHIRLTHIVQLERDNRAMLYTAKVRLSETQDAIEAIFVEAVPAKGEAPLEATGSVDHQEVFLPELHYGSAKELVCEADGSAYAHLVRGGARVVHALLRLNLDKTATRIDVGTETIDHIAPAVDGGAWVLSGDKAYRVTDSLVSDPIQLERTQWYRQWTLSTAPGEAIVFRGGKHHSDVLAIAGGTSRHIATFPEVLFSSAVADGKGGLWAIVHDFASTGRIYSGRTPFVHWDGKSWRYWGRGDEQIPGFTPAGLSPLWTGLDLHPGESGGFRTLGSPGAFTMTGLQRARILAVDANGHLVEQKPFINDTNEEELSYFHDGHARLFHGRDHANGAPIFFTVLNRSEEHDRLVPDKILLLRHRLEDGKPWLDRIAAPRPWNHGRPPQFNACAHGGVVWTGLETSIIGQEGNARRAVFTAPENAARNPR